jgi:hypothetical protein
MKTTTWAVSVLIAGLLALGCAGCKKQAASQQPQTLEQAVTQLGTALLKASPETQSTYRDGVAYNLRYGKNAEALAALDRIAGDPSLKEPQKKAVNDVIEGIKKAMAGTPAPPAQ